MRAALLLTLLVAACVNEVIIGPDPAAPSSTTMACVGDDCPMPACMTDGCGDTGPSTMSPVCDDPPCPEDDTCRDGDVCGAEPDDGCDGEGCDENRAGVSPATVRNRGAVAGTTGGVTE